MNSMRHARTGRRNIVRLLRVETAVLIYVLRHKYTVVDCISLVRIFPGLFFIYGSFDEYLF
jgi:hypothetical protein